VQAASNQRGGSTTGRRWHHYPARQGDSARLLSFRHQPRRTFTAYVIPAEAGIQACDPSIVIPAEAGIQACDPSMVIPAEAGIQAPTTWRLSWAPAFAGVTIEIPTP